MPDVVVFSNTQEGTKIFLRGKLYTATFNDFKVNKAVTRFRERGLKIKIF